jgi:hypothetical protein
LYYGNRIRSTVIFVLHKLFMGKAGRPKTPDEQKRDPGISVRLTLAEAKVINDAVTASGLKRRTEWARKSLLYVAQTGIRIT